MMWGPSKSEMLLYRWLSVGAVIGLLGLGSLIGYALSWGGC